MRPIDQSKTAPTESDPHMPTGTTGLLQELGRLRGQMDAIDDQIAELILKRIELSNRIMKTKSSSQVVDPGREQAIVERYFAKLADVSTRPKAERLVSGIIGASKLYPES